MKQITAFLSGVFMILNTGLSAQTATALDAAPTNHFTYDGQSIPHYGLQWTSDSWTGTGPTAWFSAYGGMKFFTMGTPRFTINPYGFVGIGTVNPVAGLDVGNGGVSVNGTNPVSSVSGFNNVLQLQNPYHAAIVYNSGQSTELMFGFHSNGNFYWGAPSAGYSMVLSKAGHLNVINSLSVGVPVPPAGYMMAVGGKMIAEEIAVKLKNAWPDYVFKPGYKLMLLDTLKTEIEKLGHLPGMPGAKEVQTKGVELGELNRTVVQKLEELTLYLLKMDTRMKEQEERIKVLEKENDRLKSNH